ncbi:hypothetical protein [Gemmata sp.]|uniref:hypothetical protein n=1 Tax=Gemmata sp. TaxID=1914242 RepID=UPI003F70360E
MNVAALQKHLRDLAEFLAAAEAGKPVVTELTAVHDALAPFKDEKLPAFVTFLRQAHEYWTTGVLTPKAKARKASPKNSKPPAPTIDDVRAKVAVLYETAPTASDEQINEVFGPLVGTFGLEDLKLIATAAHVEGKVTSLRAKQKVVDEIRRAITDRRGVAQRSVQ